MNEAQVSILVLALLAAAFSWLVKVMTKNGNIDNFFDAIESGLSWPADLINKKEYTRQREKYFEIFELANNLRKAEKSKPERNENGQIDYSERNDVIKKRKRELYELVEKEAELWNE